MKHFYVNGDEVVIVYFQAAAVAHCAGNSSETEKEER